MTHSLRLQSAYCCETGNARDRNEDSCLIVSTESGGHFQVAPFGLYAVADGMGGALDGHIASHAAVRAFTEFVTARLYLPLLKGKPVTGELEVLDVLERGVMAAHDAVYRPSPDENGGTTLTAALVMDRRLYLAHVGDSRAYWLVDGELRALTTDHSLVRKLQDRGQLTPEEASNYQYRNVLLQALGQDVALEIDTMAFDLPPKGWLLLCSDGLCGFVPEPAIRAVLELAPSAEQAAERLLDAALAAGSNDNVTVVVVRFAGG
jgi:protein phosphatase